jgi:hypothetical protein
VWVEIKDFAYKILRAGETQPHYIEVTRFQGQKTKTGDACREP